MAQLPPLPIDTKAWLLDTDHLSRFERGFYFDLLLLMWCTPGCRVPNDIEWIARKLVVTDDEIATLKSLIKEFCQSDGNWLTQKRLRREYDNAQRFSRFQGDNAKRKWRKEKNICPRAGASPDEVIHRDRSSQATENKGDEPHARAVAVPARVIARIPSPSTLTSASLPYPDAPESKGPSPPDDFFGLAEDAPAPVVSQKAEVDAAVAAYNGLATACGLPRCITIKGSRHLKLVMRLRELGGVEQWREVLRIVERTPFLKGENNNGWRCDIDFLLQPKSLTRVREGFYGKGSAAPTPSEHPAQLANGHVWVDKTSEAGRAWDEHLKRTTGKTAPKDQRGGWYMPTLWPPGFQGETDG